MLTVTRADRQLFRDAMSRLAASVLLVATDGPAGRRGVTITSACSVSDEPPTLLACLNEGSVHNRRFLDNANFSISVLPAALEPLARAFAGEGGLEPEARFALAEWETLQTGAPVPADAIVAFDCRLKESRTVATHRIMIGEVAAVRIGPAAPSLLYRDRAYLSL